MKKLTMIILIVTIFFGCNTELKKQNAALEAELAALIDENAALIAGDIDMEYTIADYKSMLEEIDANIASIDEKNNTVRTFVEGDAQDVEDDVLLHLQHIHGTMANTKHKVAHLQENLDEMYLNEEIDEEEIFELEGALGAAIDEILIRDEAIGVLNEVVIAEDIEIDELSVAYEEQALLSDALYDVVNTAYAIIGTKKVLKEFGIITQEGGFIGMGRVKAIAANADDDLFVPIPIDATDDIDIPFKKVKILTNHPESSYELKEANNNYESLIILDKANFWDKSDFLIIEVEKE